MPTSLAHLCEYAILNRKIVRFSDPKQSTVEARVFVPKSCCSCTRQSFQFSARWARQRYRNTFTFYSPIRVSPKLYYKRESCWPCEFHSVNAFVEMTNSSMSRRSKACMWMEAHNAALPTTNYSFLDYCFLLFLWWQKICNKAHWKFIAKCKRPFFWPEWRFTFLI